MILVDTNIPLRIAQVGHPHRNVALESIEKLTLEAQEAFCITPQSLYEMYVVCTRPIAANGGFGMSASEAYNELVSTRNVFELLSEYPQIYSMWEGLVAKYSVRGKRAHDVRPVAVMIHHQISKLLTFNDADFRSFTEIQPLNPFDVLAIPRI